MATISKSNQRPKVVIGFSAETDNIIENTKSKLISKGVDLFIANDVSNNQVFGTDHNKVYLIDKKNCEELDKQSKKSIAFKLVNKINNIFTDL